MVLRSIACISLAVTRDTSALPMMANNQSALICRSISVQLPFAALLLSPLGRIHAVADRKRADFFEPSKRADRVEADTTTGFNADL